MTNTDIRISHRKHAGPIPEGWKQQWHRRLANAVVLSISYWVFMVMVGYFFLSVDLSYTPLVAVIGMVAVGIYLHMVLMFLRRNGY